MAQLIRSIFASFFAGFIIPTLAFATISEPPSVQNPAYLFKLTYADAEGAIGFALADKGAAGKVVATISGHKEDAIFSYDKPISVEIRGLQYDAPSHRWSASLMFVSDTQVVSAIPVSGKFDEVVEVPVLKRQLRSGEIISEKDIELRDVPITATRGDTITDLASLIGKSPARVISPQRPVREQEIAAPSIVKKNALVQMHYTAPGMNISTTGQAMQEGAKGSVISVRNVTSKKLVQAVVVDNNAVDVLAQGMQSSQLIEENRHETN